VAVLIDSNVLIISVQHGHPAREECVGAFEALVSMGETACVFLQNIAEFWNVCTRPAEKNGLGLHGAEAEKRLADLDRILTFLPDTPDVYPEWRRLIRQHEVRGVQVHDARLVAGMKAHRIDRIVTYNLRDFKRYAGIHAIHPADVQ
jgi:predicted nucleic acid-binding protein